jgi:nuclear pore complex protein Nup133
MFEQEDPYSGYMDKFFATNPHPSIQWIHDLGKFRHGPASASLLTEAERTGDLEIRHVIILLPFG